MESAQHTLIMSRHAEISGQEPAGRRRRGERHVQWRYNPWFSTEEVGLDSRSVHWVIYYKKDLLTCHKSEWVGKWAGFDTRYPVWRI